MIAVESPLVGKTITVRLTDDLANWLHETSARTGLSKAQIIRHELERAMLNSSEKPFLRLAGRVEGRFATSPRREVSHAVEGSRANRAPQEGRAPDGTKVAVQDFSHRRWHSMAVVRMSDPRSLLEEPAQVIFDNGNFITLDPATPQAEAIAIRQERILAIGSREEIEKYRGEETEVVNLEGATVVPGLIDAHEHFPQIGKRVRQVFLDETRSAAEALEDREA